MYKYDIAISYQSGLAEKASKIADYLQADGLKVFFAPIEQQELLSEKLHQKLYEIYKIESMMKILLITDVYLASEWTLLEKRVSLESTKKERRRLIVVNYTDHLLPEELKPLVFLDGKKLHSDEIASAVTERAKELMGLKKEEENPSDGKNNNCDSSVVINNNHGIIAGNHAKFGDIHLG